MVPTTGGEGGLQDVVKVISLPYAVPALFVAYALTWKVVPATIPVRELVKIPVPEPSVVLLSDVVGELIVLQQTPLAVTGAPPSDVIFPPLMADVEVTAVIVDVVNSGKLVVMETISFVLSLFPQSFRAKTLKVPAEVPKLTVILVVPCPETRVVPGGTVHI